MDNGYNWKLSDQIFVLLVILTSNVKSETGYNQANTNLTGHSDRRLTYRLLFQALGWELYREETAS